MIGETSIGFGWSLMNFSVALQPCCICSTGYRMSGENPKLRAIQGLSSHLFGGFVRGAKKALDFFREFLYYFAHWLDIPFIVLDYVLFRKGPSLYE